LLLWLVTDDVVGEEPEPEPDNASPSVGELDDNNGHPALAPVPDDIDEICNRDVWTTDPEIREACASVCSAAECCNFPQQLPQSCLENNHLNCLNYHRSCVLLDDTTTSAGTSVQIQPAPDALSEICSITSLSTSAGMEECSQICGAASELLVSDLSSM